MWAEGKRRGTGPVVGEARALPTECLKGSPVQSKKEDNTNTDERFSPSPAGPLATTPIRSWPHLMTIDREDLVHSTEAAGPSPSDQD